MGYFFPSHVEYNMIEYPTIYENIMEFIDKNFEIIYNCPYLNIFISPSSFSKNFPCLSNTFFIFPDLVIQKTPQNGTWCLLG